MEHLLFSVADPPFHVVIVGQSRAKFLQQDHLLGFDPGEIDHAHLVVECTECGLVQLAYGEFGDPAVDHDRAMGPEALHESHHWYACPGCEAEIDIKVDYQEYPQGCFQPIQVHQMHGARHRRVSGIETLVKQLDTALSQKAQLEEEFKELQHVLDMEAVTPEDVVDIVRSLQAAATDLVLVFGNYRTSMGQLEEIQSWLNSQGYDARFLKDLPDAENQTFEEKARHFGHIARFIVLLDDEPGGQIAEHVYLRNQRGIVARLIPPRGGSTWMTGEVEDVDFNHIRSFPLDRMLETILEEAIEWAEDFRAQRVEAIRRGRQDDG